ncbi:hypothetical protein EH165_06520 [Nakamurella antarctica]|uniref:Hint domain-containing protein n=1 Tax=Nakamurella antarctica TaxID=1902245 RepID=A0A3G8ZV15_9ACTN|nr:polymorphic toxin-type HINT domain-containing protein [Nakamurella antarctica]AZI57856.1 hypothetical protein EH165_06520 [Nakamurella antarctica]
MAFTTGNLIEQLPIYSLPGDSGVDVGLTYNSQDGRLTRNGAGWSMGPGAHVQRFIDGSVMMAGGDGASYVFNPDGAGGFTSDPGANLALADTGSGRLTMTSPDGRTWVFDAAGVEGIGQLASYIDARGHGYTLQYGAPSANAQFLPLASITDTNGQVITVGSDDAGHITSYTVPGGRVWGFTYNAGDLTSITYPDGGVRTFTYDGAHQLLTATDPLNVLYLVNTYDTAGRVVEQRDAQNNIRRFTYNAGSTVYTDNEGNNTTYEFDTASRVTAIVDAAGGVKRFAYDGANNVVASTDQLGRTWNYTFDTAGNTTSITQPDGTVTSFTYSQTGTVTSSTDTGGVGGATRTTTFDVTSQGLVTGAHLPDGSTTAATFDAAGNVLSQTNPGGETTLYAWNSVGQLTSSTDPAGNITTLGYDNAGQAVSTTDAAGNTSTFGYDPAGNLSTVTDPAGAVTSYTYDRNGHVLTSTDPAGGVTSYTWDVLFRVASVTDPTGAVTGFEYNTEDNLTATTDPMGAVTKYTRDQLYRVVGVTDPNGNTWGTGFDATGQVTSSTDPLGAVSTNTVDANGRVITVTDPRGGVWTTEYDTVGRVTASTDAAGGVTGYIYDVLGRVVKTIDAVGSEIVYTYTVNGQIASVTDPDGRVTTHTYTPTGQVKTVTDPAGQVTSYTYDTRGHLVAVTDALGAVNTFTYDTLGRLTGSTDPLGRNSTQTFDSRGLVTAATGPDGNATTFTYDGAGRALSATDPLGAVTAQTLDPAGRVTAVTDPMGAVTKTGYDPAGQPITATDPAGTVTKYGYDPVGQLTTLIEAATPTGVGSAAANVTTTYGYDKIGNRTSVTDPNGNTTTTTTTFDALSRPTQVRNAAGVVTTKNTFDPVGEVLVSVDGNGDTTTNTYTPAGLRTQQKFANTGAAPGQAPKPDTTVGWEFDAVGRPIAMTDSVGVTGWTYDPTGQLLTETNPTGATITHAYNKAGQQTALTYPTGETLTTTFDAAGLPVAQKSPFGELKYAFDKAGRLVKEDRSNGVDTTFGYDRAGRVTTITHQLPTDPTPTALGPVAPGAGGNPAGGIAPGDYLAGWDIPTAQGQVPAGGKIVLGYGYDTRSNVTTETNTVTTSGADPKAGLAAFLTPTTVAGVAAGLAKPVTSNTQTHTYDPLDRLTATTTTTAGATAGGTGTTGAAGSAAGAGGDGTATYTYDPAGNRVSAVTTGADPTTTNATFNNLNQIISSTGTHTAAYSYDGVGQRTQETVDGSTTNYGWSPQNRLTKILRDGRTTDNTYDGIGRLQTSTDTNTTGAGNAGGGNAGAGNAGGGVANGGVVGQPTVTSSVWDGLSILAETNPASGTTSMVRDITGNVAIQASTLTTPGTGVRWNLVDAQGSPIAQTVGATITEQASYGDYGNQTFNTPGWNATVGYGGEITDPTNDLNSYYARQYDPVTATWLSPDPYQGSALASQTQNRYAFVSGNPTTNTDFLGYCPLNSSDFTGGPRCGGQPKPVKNVSVHKDPQSAGDLSSVRVTPPPVAAQRDPDATNINASQSPRWHTAAARTATGNGKRLGGGGPDMNFRPQPIDSSRNSQRHTGALLVDGQYRVFTPADVLPNVTDIAVARVQWMDWGALTISNDVLMSGKSVVCVTTAACRIAADYLIKGGTDLEYAKTLALSACTMDPDQCADYNFWQITGLGLTGIAAYVGAGMSGRGGPSRASYCSFAGETLVLMADGSKRPIKDIKVGDYVLATDPETDEQVAKEVTHLWVHQDLLTDLILDGEVITTTEDHPFWDVTDQRFERADQLDSGDKLETASGNVVSVSRFDTNRSHIGTAYNLTVQGIHTYHVGDSEILVHNTCPPLTPNQMNSAIARGQAPKGIFRIDTAKVPNEQTHVALGPGRGAPSLNIDGTWKHGQGEVVLTNKQISWLRANGWNI